MNRYTKDDTYFEKIDTEKKVYWLGFLYAGRCVYKTCCGFFWGNK